MTKKYIPIDGITIETDVPVPVNHYPIKELAVGESFTFPLAKRGAVSSRASQVKKETGRDFTIKKIDETTARIWCTSSPSEET